MRVRETSRAAFAIAVAALLCACIAPLSPAAATETVAGRLPSDTLFFLRFNRSLVNEQNYTKSLLHRIMLHDEVRSLKGKKRWDWRIDETTGELSPRFNLDDILALFDREIAIALLEPVVAPNRRLSGVLLAADIRGKRRDVEQLAGALRLRFVSALPRIEWGPDPAGSAVTRIRFRGATAFYTIRDDYLVAASDRKTLEKGIGALEAAPPDSLAAAPSFREAVKRVGEESPVLAYINIRKLLEKVASSAPGGRGKFPPGLLSALPKDMSAAVRFAPPGVMTTAFLAVPRSTASTPAARTLARDSFRIVPADSPSCAGIAFDGEAVYESMSKLLGSLISPTRKPTGTPSPVKPAGSLDALNAFASGKVGFDIKQDLLPLVKGDLIAYQSPGGGLLFPDYVVAVPVSNPRKVSNCLDLLSMAFDRVSLREGRYGGTTIKALTVRVGEGRGVRLSLYCAIADNLLLFSSGVPSLKDGLAHAISGGDSIIDTADFKSVTAHLPTDVFYLSYRMPGRDVEYLYSLLITALDMLSTIGVDLIDPLELPRRGTFSEKFFGSATAGQWHDGGLLVTGFSPMGIETETAIRSGQGLAVAGILSAAAIPNFIRARSASQLSACRENTRMIEAAKKMYGIERGLSDGDSFPAERLNSYLVSPLSSMKCPAGGSYENIGVLGEPVRCSIHK